MGVSENDGRPSNLAVAHFQTTVMSQSKVPTFHHGKWSNYKWLVLTYGSKYLRDCVIIYYNLEGEVPSQTMFGSTGLIYLLNMMIFQFAKLNSHRVACANRAAPATKDPVGIENIEGPRPAVMLGSNTPDPKDVMWGHTLWLMNIAMENGPCIDGLPFLKMV